MLKSSETLLNRATLQRNILVHTLKMQSEDTKADVLLYTTDHVSPPRFLVPFHTWPRELSCPPVQ